ncbi:MAG: hypothetical protein B7X84_08110, partial [Alphaproteobacteria bacterium 17-39-52]
ISRSFGLFELIDPRKSSNFYIDSLMNFLSGSKVLEFKFAKSEASLHLLAEKALEQIDLKNYEAKIKACKNVASTFKVGIAFGGKDVAVAFK